MATEAGIARAGALLRAGALVAFGTETVYGLGANARDPAAVARIFEAKGRPRFNPLIAHLPDAAAAFSEVVPNALARRLAEAFWPGPLTLVLPRHPDSRVASLAAAGLGTLGVRVPDAEPARALLRAAGFPVVAPSANPSGGVSPSTADHVLAGLAGRVDAVLDTGPCPVGLESTVLDLSGDRPVLLRPGGIPLEALEAEIGPLGRPDPHADVASPGMLASHYAPSLPVRLDAATAHEGEALLAFGPAPGHAGLCWNLSPSGDLREAAARLFSGLRHLDEEGRRRGLTGIAAMPIPERDLGLAIRDRLTRAAAPRPLAATGRVSPGTAASPSAAGPHRPNAP